MRQVPVHDVSAVILAGGESRRIVYRENAGAPLSHFNKALLPWGNTTMVQHVIRTYRSVFQTVLVLSNEPLSFGDSWVLIVPDRICNNVRSSKVGILNALHLADKERVCIGACDMPLVSSDLLRLLASLHQEKDLVIPLVDHFLQPMPAVYSRNCIPVLKRQVEQGNHRLLDFFGSVQLGLVDESEMDKAEIRKTAFLNVNTWEDYEIVLQSAHTAIN